MLFIYVSSYIFVVGSYLFEFNAANLIKPCHIL